MLTKFEFQVIMILEIWKIKLLRGDMMKVMYEDLEILEYFFEQKYITLKEYYEIKRKIIEKFTNTKG